MWFFSSETVNFFLPFALRLANTRLPLADDILSLNPCLFLRFLLEGWNVLFMFYLYLKVLTNDLYLCFYFWTAKVWIFFCFSNIKAFFCFKNIKYIHTPRCKLSSKSFACNKNLESKLVEFNKSILPLT